MGFVNSAWARALGGAGAAASGIANKYIDEEIQNNRAQFLADLQHQNMVRGDKYQLSDERQAQVRKNATDATMAQGAAQRANQVAGATDTTYQGALDTEAKLGATRKIDAEKQALTELTPAKIAVEK